MKLSIVVPCYNEELNIPTFYSEVTKLEKDLPEGSLFEFIFVMMVQPITLLLL